LCSGRQVNETTSLASADYTIDSRDNEQYKTVKIGNQIWMAENLRSTKFNDGTAIPFIEDKKTWRKLTVPAYCVYDNDMDKHKMIYGNLYNWYVVNMGKLCPAGWHVPTHDEWTALSVYLGGESVAGGKLKETGTIHWKSSNDGATNESGFTALPGGIRNLYGNFVNIVPRAIGGVLQSTI
jgi:uncharacterized protein (TIGR02145 family)